MLNRLDKVRYTGHKFHELNNRVGDIVARVSNSNDTFVVEFGDDSYVMHESVLSKYRGAVKENEFDEKTLKKWETE